MAKIKPTKSSENVSRSSHAVKVVTHSRLAADSHGAVFPQAVDGGHPFGHMSPRNGPDMSGAKKAVLTK